MRIIGAADEFWRLRVTRVDVADGLDFEWHPDILYRRPSVGQIDEVETWYVEAVKLDDVETVVRVAGFAERDDADKFVQRATDDLAEMTKSQFEDAYLSGDVADADDSEDGSSEAL
ncbi:MAG TPA: hypothetical protein VFG89_02025 [Coriobacteriia bacterium]|nr:hypothetical protein [Coriobacteriia bacterium]